MRVSYSALQTYKTCPLKFKCQVLDKIKVPKGIEAVFGSAIHSSLKYMFQRNPLYPSLDEVINFFTNKWQTTMSDIVVDKTYFEEGVSMLKSFYKKNPPWNFNAVELESRFEVNIEETEYDKNHVLVGIIDRIDKSPDNNIYEIIDYKTSKRMPSQEMLDKDLQLSIYNLGLLKKWPHLSPDNIKLSLYYLKHNEKIETKRTSHNLNETKNKIIKLINEIESLINNKKEFVPTPSALCDWCGYMKMCPMWKHLYAKPDNQITSDQITNLIDEHFGLKEQNSQNNKRLKTINASVATFMDERSISRVFNENGYLTRILQERTSYDMPKIKALLKSLKKWDEKELTTSKKFPVFKASKKKI